MDCQRFIEQLPSLYENWGEEGVCPKSGRFQEVLELGQGMTTANIMQLLNFAVSCMEPDEVYCEIGSFQGASLIGALLDNPDKMACAVDDFSEFDTWGDSFEKFRSNLSNFNLEERVYFCRQDFEEFLVELREVNPSDKIGVYYYDGAHDYRSHLMGLLLVRPFLADKALIVISHSNWEAVRQSSWDFVAVNPQAKLLLDLPAPKYGDSKFWNGLQVFSWDIEEAGNYSWSAFQEVRNQSVIQAIYNLQSPSRGKIVETIYKEALALDVSEALAAGLAAGKTYSAEFLQKVRKDLLKAEQKYKQVLQWDKDNVEVWLKLGRLYYVLEQYQESLEVLLKSLEIAPAGAIQHYSLGLVLEKIGEIPEAIRAYQEAIALQPNLIDAYNNLGNILVAAGEMERAESVYRQAIAANPEHFGSYLNLGNVLMARGDVDAGIAAYETALKLSPNNPDILNNLGVALQAKTDDTRASLYLGHAFYHQGRYEKAISEYQKFLASQTGDVNFYIALAECYNRSHRYEEAIKVYREGIRLYPATANLYSGLVSGLQECGRTREAIEVAAVACRLFPDDLEFRLKKYLTLPILYESQEEIDFSRRRFSQGLEELIQTTSTPEARNEALRATSRHNNLYLQYQGYNDLEFQKQYGQFVHRLVAAKYPEWVDKRAMPPLSKDGKIRIGYISNCLQYDVAGDLLIGWLRNCDQQNFEVYCYYLDSQIDQQTLHYRTCCDKFYHIPNGLEAVSRQILADQLHILVFPDIGRYALITQIAALRLAPVQCTTWAHPITSGLPTIDYFLSSDLMEPENAQEH
jgi:protein O-GlcNAc transferase